MRTRWGVLGIAMLVELTGGLMYMFGVISPLMKTHFNLTQGNVDLMGSVQNVGSNLGFWWGMLYDRFGPRVVLSCMCLIGTLGWLSFWVVIHFNLSLPFPVLLAMIYVNGQQAFCDVSIVALVSRAFPENRGLALGIAKSFVGLSGSVVTQFYDGLFKPDIVSFLLFLAGVSLVVTAVGATLIFRVDPPTFVARDTRRRLYTVLGLVVGLAFLILAFALSQQFFDVGVGKVVMTAVIGVYTLGVVVHLNLLPGDVEAAAEDDGSLGERQALLGSGSSDDGGKGSALSAPDRQYTLRQAMGTPEYFGLFSVFLLAGGSGLMLIGNVAQISRAFGGKPGDEDVFVSIISVCNCLGRIVGGVVSDTLLRRHHVPRCAVFAGACVVLSLSIASLSLASTPLLYLACVAVGLSYGSFNSLMPAVLGDMYGNRSFGLIYTTNSLGLGAGSYSLATLLTGHVYQSHCPPNSHTCIGKGCFRLSFLVCSGCSLVAAFVLATIATRSKLTARYRLTHPKPVSTAVN